MKRKILSLAAVVLACGMMAPASMADSVVGKVILSQGYFSSGQGGEFKATINYVAAPDFKAVQDASVKTPGLTPVPAGSLGSAADATFQTFCIQAGAHDVYFNPGVTYTANVISPNLNPSTSAPWLYLTDATKALYHAFSTGTLTGYDYTNTAAGRSRSAGELQAAIWVAQGNFASLTISSETLKAQSGISDNFTQAQAWLDLATTGTLAGTGANVHAFNMLDEGGGNHQAQLMDTDPLAHGNNPVPLPATVTLGLSMLGGLGVWATLRKRLGLKPQMA